MASVQSMVRPGVQIQQEFVAVTATQEAPLLPTVVVGLNVQTVANTSAGSYTGSSLAFAYPTLEFGAIVDLTSIAVTLQNVVLTVLNHPTADATFVNDVVTDTTSTFITSGIAQGDTFVATSGIVTYSAQVLAVTSETTLQLDRYLPFTTASFVVTRPASTQTVAGGSITATSSSVTLAASLTVGGLHILSATAFITYNAVRALTVGVLTEVFQATEIDGKLLPASTTNKLALGVQCAKSNTITSVLALAVPDESAASFLDALDFLSNKIGIYTIILLTQDPTTQSLLKTHVEQLADPTKSKFRTGVINLPHPLETVVIEETQAASLARVSGIITLAHPTAAFSGVVNVGDYVKLTARTVSPVTVTPAHAGIYRVQSVINNGVLTLANNFYAGSNGNYTVGAAISADFAADALDFDIIRVLDKAGQALAIAETASSYGNRRIIYVTNATCTVNVAGVDTVVPGYYLAAAIAGMNAGNQPHQGFTNLGISGISAVQFGNNYFNEDQLGLIGGSGGFVVEQSSPTALPTAYYQTTTDNTSTETKEYSITKTIDYFCIGLKQRTSGQIGISNVFAGTLAALANTINGWHKFLLARSFPLIGAPLITANLVSVEQDPLQPDTVDIVDDITVPTPLNNVKITVRVSL